MFKSQDEVEPLMKRTDSSFKSTISGQRTNSQLSSARLPMNCRSILFVPTMTSQRSVMSYLTNRTKGIGAVLVVPAKA
jgi:hypothetical protein